VPSPIVITADQSTTFTLVADYSSVTVAAGVTVAGPDTSTGFALDATAGAGGTISVYGTLTGGGGIYDPTSTRPGYNVTIYKQGSITATMGYGIALQKQATVINYGEITAHQVGISLGAGESIAINDGSITADVGIQAFGDNTIIDNGGMIDAAVNGIVVTGGNANTITNGGIIHAGQVGIWLYNATGLSTTTNTGTITADVLAFRGSASANEFINHGTIQGSVDMRGGDDVFDNRGGTVSSTILLGDGNDKAFGGDGSETFTDWFGNDTIDAGGGIDTLSYELSQDPTLPVKVDLRISTEQTSVWGTDTFLNFENVTGAVGNDTITGSDGDNVLKGLGGADSLSGAGGNDTLIGGDGNDMLDGGDGIDTADYSSGIVVTVDLRLETVQDTGVGNDALTGIENLFGGVAGDRLTGNAAANVLIGGGGADLLSGDAGNDSLNGGAGNDVLDGGTGNDTAIFAGTRSSYVIVTNADGTCTVTDTIPNGNGTDTLRNVEFARFDDATVDLASLKPPTTSPVTPVPSQGPTSLVLRGTSSANRLTGGGGDDRIYGKAGNDVLTGGAGKDVFVFDTKPNKKTNMDKIVDFNVKDDTIWLDNAIFKKLGKGSEAKPGKLNKAFFTIGDHAKDKNDYLVYDTRKGVLSYDADGSGKGKAVEITTLKKGLKMTYLDFMVI
jgi:Ca2+-binding RTX toxin-like protein